ncbi:MAG: ESCRT-III subunit protein snf7 [Piccolia ochrophora]|nr:MAG: ESCRT-III subunit protein snf7 [Piccolia ochrophora]
MSSLMSWFSGNSSQKRKAAPKEAIVVLRAHLEMLQKRELHLQNQIDEQQNIARKNINNQNKNISRSAIKRKKQHEHSLEQTTAQIATLEQQIYSIEAANINQETLKAMQKAGKAMAEIHGGLTIDKVDETMDQLREQHTLGEDIANAITSAPIGEPVDTTELDEEMDRLEQEEIDNKMLGTGAPVNQLPAAANGECQYHPAVDPFGSQSDANYVAPTVKAPPSRARDEEDEEAELAKLQAEMAM